MQRIRFNRLDACSSRPWTSLQMQRQVDVNQISRCRRLTALWWAGDDIQDNVNDMPSVLPHIMSDIGDLFIISFGAPLRLLLVSFLPLPPALSGLARMGEGVMLGVIRC